MILVVVLVGWPWPCPPRLAGRRGLSTGLGDRIICGGGWMAGLADGIAALVAESPAAVIIPRVRGP